jgi:hypothetical protein
MKPGAIGAIALACGFWISQIIACNLVSSSMLGFLPKLAGIAALAAFALFFAARMLHSGSRWPAIFGLCSLGELMMLVSSATRVNYGFQMQPAGMFVLLSLALGFAGIALDVERCWRPVANARTTGQRPETTSILDASHQA